MEIVKISLLAKELGISHKTIYNWVRDGRLKIIKPGYVNRIDAWEVYEHMQTRKTSFQSLLAKHGIDRDKNGRFANRKKDSK
jgi:excisionase family DNA binding protein